MRAHYTFPQLFLILQKNIINLIWQFFLKILKNKPPKDHQKTIEGPPKDYQNTTKESYIY